MSARPFVATALVLVGCHAPAPPAARAAEGPVATSIEAPKGVILTSACTPTGVERCFDAKDDNCNGLIDEGCGIRSGLLQFTIAWSSRADVDLLVTDPSGELARVGEPTSSGLRKDRDCGASDDECHGQNLENVYFDGSDPPRGRYRVELGLVGADPALLPVRVRLGARVGARTYGADVDLTGTDDPRAFLFTL